MKRTKADVELTLNPKRQRVLLALGWYSIAIHRGITRFAHDAGWVLSGGFVRHGWFPAAWRGDGIITVLGVHADVDEQVLALGLPTVNIGYNTRDGIPSVSADSEAVGRMAAEHFLSRGFKHFAFFESSRALGERMRRSGYEVALKARGQTCHLLSIPPTPPRGQPIEPADDLHLLGRQLLDLPNPIAVLAEYDDRALDIMDAALLAGLRVPEQVAVLGVDNDELRCPFAPVPLSSIDNDEERIGYEAARILHDLMNNKPAPAEPLRIPPRRVVVRQSTNILAIPHEHVAMALKMIWEHYHEPIDAIRVAAEVPLSYPQLHISFVKYVGRSMADEIERLRLEHAQQLLITTDFKLSDVAHRSGFGSADRMGRVFVRMLKTSPSEYRIKMQGASSAQAIQRGTSARPAAFQQI